MSFDKKMKFGRTPWFLFTLFYLFLNPYFKHIQKVRFSQYLENEQHISNVPLKIE